MDLNGIPLFSLITSKLGYLNEREKVIAQNVANASTPGFTPHDLKPFSEQPGMNTDPMAPKALAPVAVVQTNALHLTGSQGGAGSQAFANIAAPDSETTLNGNQVVLEEQMIKMSDARSDYDTAISFYQKALGMLHLAVQKPGG
jgi:flagellar basal-body rod protein FlgB